MSDKSNTGFLRCGARPETTPIVLVAISFSPFVLVNFIGLMSHTFEQHAVFFDSYNPTIGHGLSS